MKYRPEVDGIRTLAIVPVLIYHLKIPFVDGYLLPGGFLGVDVFLVISGFLITRIILDELLTTGAFSLRNFYERRARRILPALIMVILFSMVTGVVLLSPTELNRLGLSALAALGFVSNAYWFTVLGEYGAQSGLLQPLLHTWSLAIEEQFYLVFPLFLIALKPMRRPLMALSIICGLLLLSLCIAEVTTSINKQLSFFSPVSRAWELLVGSLMAFGLTYFPNVAQPGPRLVWALPKLSLLVLATCMFTIDLANWNHPGVVTLPVVLATAAIIWCARSGETVTDMLSTAAFVFVGRISYSLYLWHFPIFAFGRLGSVEKPSALDMLVWIGLTFVCSIAGYYLVEQRFRRKVGGRAFAITLGTSVATILAFVIVDTRTDLLRQGRTNDLTALYGGNFHDNELLRDQTWGILDRLAGDTESIGTWNAHRPSESELTQLWFDDPDLLNILIIGNSHSKDLFNALYLANERNTTFQLARFGMATRFPTEQRAQLFASPNFARADVIMIATRYPADVEDVLPDMVSELHTYGKTVAIVGSTPEFVSPGSMPIYDWYIQRQANRTQLEKVNSIAFGSQVSTTSKTNAALRDIAVQSGSIFLSRNAMVCSQAERSCALATPDGNKTMYDYSHWTIEGARYFGSRAIKMGWLDQVTNPR